MMAVEWLIFLFLCVAPEVAPEVTLDVREITEPLTWHGAFTSGRCDIPPSTHTDGYVDPESLHIDISVFDVEIDEAWVGMYTMVTNMIKFEGCFLYYEDTILNGSVPSSSLEEKSDVIAFCYSFCNASRFALSGNMCYCVGATSPTTNGLCVVHRYTGIEMCPSNHGGICGGGTITQTNTQCLCVYQSMNAPQLDFLDHHGDCVAYNGTSDNFTTTDCSLNNYYVCIENTETRTVIFPDIQESWWDSALSCQSIPALFGNRRSLKRHFGERNGSDMNMYWVNAFRKTFYSFISTDNTDFTQCVAVKNNSGNFTLISKDCDVLLPTLCTSATIDTGGVSTPDQTTQIVDDTSGSGQTLVNTTSGDGEISNSTSTSAWPFVFVCFGIIVILAVVLLMYLRKRSGRFIYAKSSKVKSIIIQSPGMKIEVPKALNNTTVETNVSNAEKKSDEINYEKAEEFVESGTSQTNEKSTSEQNDSVQPNAQEGSKSDDIYNELHEKSQVQNDDTYDHVIQIKDEGVYDESVGGEKKSEEFLVSEYDTIENVKTQ